MAEIVQGGRFPKQTTGSVFHAPLAYDVLLRILWRGAERVYREQVLDVARVDTGESILDVGCGTGTLALAAKRRVGNIGKVSGIDASAEMIARARKKAAKARTDIDLRIATAEALPFENGAFDAVLSTTVLHCLPRDARAQAIREMARVLRPAGRLLLVDFGGTPNARRSLMSHLGPHRRFDLREIMPLLREIAVVHIRSGALGFSDLEFVSAVAVG